MTFKSMTLVIFIFFSLQGLAFSGGSAPFTRDSVSLEINKRGFELISKLAQERLLNNLENQKLNGINLSIPLVANLNVKNITFSAQFEKVKITPFDNGLDIDLGIRNLEIQIGEVRFSNFFIPSIGTSCFGTKINIANGRILPIKAKLGLRMENGLIKLKNYGFNFNLNRYQYKSKGPAECIGAFGVTDYLAKFLVENVLTMARPAINLALNAGVDILATDLGTLLFTQIDKLKIPLKLPNLLIIPESTISLGFKIDALKITSEKMKMVLSVAVERENLKSDEPAQVPEVFKYGTLGVNPEFFNRLLGVLIPDDGTREIEITSDFHEMVDKILLTSEFSNFIPDLATIETDSDRLRLFISFKKLPTLAIKGDGLHVEIPDLTMKLMVEQKGKWIDYFFAHIKTALDLNVSVTEGKILAGIKLDGLTMTGEFAPSYKPNNPLFLSEEFAESLKILVELFTENDEGGMKLDLPFFVFDNEKITLGDIRVKAPYLYIDVVGYPVE